MIWIFTFWGNFLTWVSPFLLKSICPNSSGYTQDSNLTHHVFTTLARGMDSRGKPQLGQVRPFWSLPNDLMAHVTFKTEMKVGSPEAKWFGAWLMSPGSVHSSRFGKARTLKAKRRTAMSAMVPSLHHHPQPPSLPSHLQHWQESLPALHWLTAATFSWIALAGNRDNPPPVSSAQERYWAHSHRVDRDTHDESGPYSAGSEQT